VTATRPPTLAELDAGERERRFATNHLEDPLLRGQSWDDVTGDLAAPPCVSRG
jgi:hypothetical protein